MSESPDPRLEAREGWGMSTQTVSRVVYPESEQDIRDAFDLARKEGLTVAFWGNGRSYGDAALNDSQLLLDFTRMNRVLDFDDETGIARLEPGVTLVQLERYALQRGFYPPVVSGTMYTTIGGCAAANVHGKNNWKYGPWGDHILRLKVVTPDGRVRTLSRDDDPELFRWFIGGFGLLGAFVEITVKLKKVHSGRVKVTPLACGNLNEMFAGFERYNEADYDYVVGWVDGFASGTDLGRGQIHAAQNFKEGEDPEGAGLMQPEHQQLPARFFVVIPKGWLWWLAKPFSHRLGMRLINWGRYMWMELGTHSEHLQSHAQFNHLLDFVPNWKWFYPRTGLIQYQLFVPKDEAERVFRQALEMSQRVGLEPWLVVMKRHRDDEFPLSHAVDGYSFAMDFPVTDKNRETLWRMCQRFSDLVVESGGKFYFAKDSVVSSKHVLGAWGPEVLGRLFAVKKQVDPDTLLQGNLWRRVFSKLTQSVDPRSEPLPPPPTTAPPFEKPAPADAAPVDGLAPIAGPAADAKKNPTLVPGAPGAEDLIDAVRELKQRKEDALTSWNKSMRKAELLEVAEARGLDVTSKMRKTDIIEALEQSDD